MILSPSVGFDRLFIGKHEPITVKDKLPPFPETPWFNGEDPVKFIVALVFVGMLAAEYCVSLYDTDVI